MSTITNYFLAYLDREEAEQRMNNLSDDAIRELLTIKPEGGRLPINDDYSIELSLVPTYNLKGKRGWAATIWREAQKMLRYYKDLVSKEIERMRKCGEEYADEHPDYQPEWTAVLKVINLQKEKEAKRKRVV